MKGKNWIGRTCICALLFGIHSPLAQALDARDVFRKTAPAVVVVLAKDAQGEVSKQGSGVLVLRDLIVTNCHVVADSAMVSLYREGKEIAASVKSRDDERDLCLLRPQQAVPGGIPASISSTEHVEVGQVVFAVGAPLGLELTISDGIVSGLRKAVGGRMVQFTAPISPGSSGGGLFDSDGNLVGITTSQRVQGQNLNFAVPAEWIQQVAVREELQRERRRVRAAYRDEVRTLRENADDEGIIRASQLLLDKDLQFIEGHWDMATALQKVGRKEDAEQVYRRMMDISPETFDDVLLLAFGAINLSSIYRKSGRPSLARLAAGQAASLLPIEGILETYRSHLLSPDDYREAVPLLTQATQLFPDSPYGWAHLGAALLNTGAAEKAIPVLQRATTLKPDYEWAWFGYLLALRQLRRQDELERLVAYLEQNQPRILINLSRKLKNE